MERVLGLAGRPHVGACRARRRCSPAPARTSRICWSSRPRTAASPAASTPRSCARRARQIRELKAAGKTVKILTIGRKGRDGLRRDYARLILDSLTDIGRRRVSFDEARDIAAAHPGDVRGRRVRHLHDRLQPLPLGDDPDRHGPAADPVRAARSGRCARRRPAARSTSSSPTRRKSSPSCCRATSRCRSTPRCSRTRRASRARA